MVPKGIRTRPAAPGLRLNGTATWPPTATVPVTRAEPGLVTTTASSAMPGLAKSYQVNQRLVAAVSGVSEGTSLKEGPYWTRSEASTGWSATTLTGPALVPGGNF